MVLAHAYRRFGCLFIWIYLYIAISGRAPDSQQFSFELFLGYCHTRALSFWKALSYLYNLSHSQGFFSMYHPQDGLIGTRGEAWAQIYLKRKGYQILATNYVNPLGRRLGEIDIIAQDKDFLVFIEVKTRIADPRSHTIILPEENITRNKLRKLTKIAEFYLRDTKQFDVSHRFDAISLIYSPQDKKVSVKHIENIFYS